MAKQSQQCGVPVADVLAVNMGKRCAKGEGDLGQMPGRTPLVPGLPIVVTANGGGRPDLTRALGIANGSRGEARQAQGGRRHQPLQHHQEAARRDALGEQRQIRVHVLSSASEPGHGGTRGYNCTPEQSEKILKAYKDVGVYLVEDAPADKAKVVEIATSTIPPCPESSDDEASDSADRASVPLSAR